LAQCGAYGPIKAIGDLLLENPCPVWSFLKELHMETENLQLTKGEVAQALCIDSKTMNRYIKNGYFTGPAAIENGVEYRTMRQIEEFLDRPW
jgi:hypothetical protein